VNLITTNISFKKALKNTIKNFFTVSKIFLAIFNQILSNDEDFEIENITCR